MIRFLFPTDVAMMWFAWVNIVQDDYFLCPGISEITAISNAFRII